MESVGDAIYLVAEASGFELPLVVTDTIKELCDLTGRQHSSIWKNINYGFKTRLWNIPVRIYKISMCESDN